MDDLELALELAERYGISLTEAVMMLTDDEYIAEDD